MSSQEEQRHFPRSRPTDAVSLTLRRDPAAADQRPLHLLCRDVSLAGLGVVFPYAIAPDTDVELWVGISDRAEPLHLFGTVAWCAAPNGQWQAGIALDLERGDGAAWAGRFRPPGASA